MSVCSKCFKAVSRSSKHKIQCKECNGYFHWACVNLTQTEVDVLESSKKPFLCDSCVKKRRVSRSFSDPSVVEPKSDKMALTLENIQILLEKMKEEILQGQNKIESDLGKAINDCQERISENNKLIESQKKLIEEQQNAIFTLQQENNRLRSQVKVMSDRQTDLEQYSRRNTLEIFGLPEERNESSDVLKKKVMEVGAALGAEFSEEAIDACHRIGGGNNRPTSGILVKFLRRDDADNLLQGRKVKRDFSTRHLSGYKDDSPVYVNVSLAPARRVLFAKARKLKTDFHFKYVWVDRAGRVKARKSDDEDSRILVIGNEDELAKLVDRETKQGAGSGR